MTVNPLSLQEIVNSNKGDFGYIGILGGCDMYSGAI